MRASFVFLSSGVVALCATVACGGSSGTGGAGGTGTTSATSSQSATSSSSKASSSASTTASGTGGAGGGSDINCNPVNDVECGAGNVCDFADPTGFICYVGPGVLDVCTACDYANQSMPYCKDGLSCMPTDAGGTTGTCVRFCCSDADCGGAAGSCEKNTLTGDPNVGFCGASDAGHTFVMTPVCTAPTATPTGTCYTTPP